MTFTSVVFSADLILSNLSNKNDSRGSGGMLIRKIFKNLRKAYCNGHFSAFYTIVRQILYIFLALKISLPLQA